jgi:hypothetical protein
MTLPRDINTPTGSSDDGRQPPETDGQSVRERAESHLWQVEQMHLDAFEVAA